MKAVLLLALATVMVLGHNAAVVNGRSAGNNLELGAINVGDTLLHRETLQAPGFEGIMQYREMTYRGSPTTRISAIQAREVGFSQSAMIGINSGGIGANHVTLGVQSMRGNGYHYLIEIWGRP